MKSRYSVCIETNNAVRKFVYKDIVTIDKREIAGK